MGNHKDIKIKYGHGTSEHGPGVKISLGPNELASAIDLYLVANDISAQGPRTIMYKGELLESGLEIYVDPSGRVIDQLGNVVDGRGPGCFTCFSQPCNCQAEEDS